MAAKRTFGKALLALAAFAAGAVVTSALAGSRRGSAPPPPAPAAIVEKRPPPELSPEPIPSPPPPVPPPPVSAPPPAAIPAATAPEDRRGDDEVAEELQSLREEIARMQKDLAEARANAQTAILRDLDRHVVGVREELVQQEANRAAEADAAQDAAVRRQQAVEMLIGADARLAIGDSRVVGELEAAAPALPMPAQAAIRNARARLESEDLFAARSWLALAIAASIRTQLAQ